MSRFLRRPIYLVLSSAEQELMLNGWTYMTCMTLPKLPFPTTFNSSKSSIFRVRCRFSTKVTPSLRDPVPNVTSSHSAPLWPNSRSCWAKARAPFSLSFLLALGSSTYCRGSSNLGFTLQAPSHISSLRPAPGLAFGFRRYSCTDRSVTRETSNLYCVLSPAQ